jgi:hypothetical protein
MFGDDKKNGSSWAFSTGSSSGSSWAFETPSSSSSPFTSPSQDSSWAYSTGSGSSSPFSPSSSSSPFAPSSGGSSWAYDTGNNAGNGSGWAYGSGSHSLGNGYAHSYLSHCNYGQRPILNSAYAPTYHNSFFSSPSGGGSDAFKPVSFASNNSNTGVFRIDPWFGKKS